MPYASNEGPYQTVHSFHAYSIYDTVRKINGRRKLWPKCTQMGRLAQADLPTKLRIS